jgi:hypothetical protein
VIATPTPPPGERICIAELGLRDPLQNPLFERELAGRYLLFDAWVDGERRVNLHPLLLSQALHQQAIEAATSAAALVEYVADQALRDPEEARRYRFSPDVARLAQAAHQAGDRSRLVRVDLLLSEAGWQACEINADCPGGHNEALALPRLAQAAGFWQGLNPTTVVDDLVQALIAQAAGKGAIALLYATAYAEDLQVCALIQRELRRHGARTVLAAPTALRRRGRRLYIGEEPIAQQPWQPGRCAACRAFLPSMPSPSSPWPARRQPPRRCRPPCSRRCVRCLGPRRWPMSISPPSSASAKPGCSSGRSAASAKTCLSARCSATRAGGRR